MDSEDSKWLEQTKLVNLMNPPGVDSDNMYTHALGNGIYKSCKEYETEKRWNCRENLSSYKCRCIGVITVRHGYMSCAQTHMQSEADTQPCNGCEIAYPGQMVLTAHAKVSARLNHCENAQKKIVWRQCQLCQLRFRHDDELNTCLIMVHWRKSPTQGGKFPWRKTQRNNTLWFPI